MRSRLSRWCRAVGAPGVRDRRLRARARLPRSTSSSMVSWNAHLAEGELGDLIDKLRAGALTAGGPSQHFVAARPGTLSSRRRRARIRRARSIGVCHRAARSGSRRHRRSRRSRSGCRSSTCRRCATARSSARIAATRSFRPSRCSIRSRSNCRWRVSAASRSARPSGPDERRPEAPRIGGRPSRAAELAADAVGVQEPARPHRSAPFSTCSTRRAYRRRRGRRRPRRRLQHRAIAATDEEALSPRARVVDEPCSTKTPATRT